MPFHANIRIRNPKPYDTSGMIYAGTVLETTDPFSRVQNLAVSENVPFTVRGGDTTVVSVPAWCLNESFAPPAGTPMRLTSLAVHPYESQQDAWRDMNQRR